MYLGDFKEDGDVFFKFTTRAFATGIPTVLAGTPVLSVFIDENTTGKTTAESYFDLDVSLGSIVGYNNVRIDLSGDAFFATGADYSVVITTGTVGGVSVVGEVVGHFSIENRSMGQPAGATLAADIAAIKALLPAALVSGRMDSSIDGTGMESGAVDAVWAKTMTELAAVPGVTGTVLAALEWLFELSRNKGLQTSTTKTLRNDADDADIATSAISSDGTTFTREKWS